ncbi:putative mis12 domain-protein [Rhypophila decipiens]|uniref:Mis12 domain-protein n=1 Tax=Rhypophila decipiens TaxID=261697 RepID=A0AAN6Y3F9_9PEZI|nr:putative mis12 domain-protein [Rhypophila decipiens]
MASNDVELLTEHFGYPPVSLLDDIINSINILAERALNSVEQGLLNAPLPTVGFRQPTYALSAENNPHGLPLAEDARRQEVEAGTHQLETLLCASIDRNFDKFELYVMRNILCVKPADVRDWIRLSHYEGLDFTPPSPEPELGITKPSVESINRLRRRLQASQKLNTMLHAERARNEALLEEIRKLVGGSLPTIIKKETPEVTPQPATTEGTEEEKQPMLAFLQHKGALANSGASESPITTTADFTLSQLQALRALSTSLRRLMPDLGLGLPSQQTEEKEDDEEGETEAGKNKKPSWRRERLEYVETATRKHLENVRGLELGKNGEVRDDEGEWWAGEGGIRKLGEGEVDSLEGVVKLLGGAAAETGQGGGQASQRGGREGSAGPRTRSSRSASASAAPGNGGDGDMMDEM